MKLRKVKRTPLPELVASEIEEAIFDQTFAFDARLPSEQQLAEQLGVSRNVVREAFKLLRERGLISTQSGSSAQVVRPSTEATSNALGRYLRLSDAPRSIQNLYEVRRLLEGETARLAALRADETDLNALKASLERMADAVGSIERWTEADLTFHLAIARASHNPLFTVLLQPLVEQLRNVIAEGFLEAGGAERGYGAHQEIYRSIKASDPDYAQEAIINHLRDSESRLKRLCRESDSNLTAK